MRRRVDEIVLSRSLARQSKKQPWEISLLNSEDWRGWGLSEHYGKMRLKLQFPAGASIASASATLPYPWAASSIQPIQGLLTRIYGPVMEGGVPLKLRLECCLALKKFLEYAVAKHR